MENFRSLLVEKLQFITADVSIFQLSLNRHIDRAERVPSHTHTFSQLILYFTGSGKQNIGSNHFLVQPGSLFFIPPKTKHSFTRKGLRSPLSLTLNLSIKSLRKPAFVQLNKSQFSQIRQYLSHIGSEKRIPDSSPSISLHGYAALIVDLLIKAFEGNFHLKKTQHPVVKMVIETLQKPALTMIPIHEIAQHIGYQHDYLNRMLKKETGLTLSQFRSQLVMKKAKELLQEPLKVTEVSDRLEFSDQNYFARWFRQHTGCSPSKWVKLKQ
jgi:AraC family transcriptional activator of pobA